MKHEPLAIHSQKFRKTDTNIRFKYNLRPSLFLRTVNLKRIIVSKKKNPETLDPNTNAISSLVHNHSLPFFFRTLVSKIVIDR